MAVTRVASEEEGATLGAEIGRQLLAQPGPLAAVSALLGALALAPGLPAAPFLVLAGAAGAAAWRLGRRPPDAAPPLGAARPDGLAVEDPLGGPAPVALELADDLLAVASAGTAGADGLAALRVGVWRELGVRLPPVALRRGALAPGGFRVLVDEVPVATGVAPADEAVIAVAPDELALVGIAATPEADPLSGRAVAVIAARDAARAAALGPVRAPLDRVLAGRRGRARARRRQLRRRAGGAVAARRARALGARAGARGEPPATAGAARRGAAAAGRGGRLDPPAADHPRGPARGGRGRAGRAALADAARRALRRHLGHALAGDGPLDALLLDPAAEELIREALTGESLAMDPRVAAALVDGLAARSEATRSRRCSSTSPDVRRALRGLIAPRFPRISVLAYEELPPELPVSPLGRVALAA